jgi:hypothetical protein
MEFFLRDEGDEEGVFIDDNCSSTTESFDERNPARCCLLAVDKLLLFPGNSHDDRRRRSDVDDAPVAAIGTQKRFFEEELGMDGMGPEA